MIIKGIPSGDCECWCFLVDKETFESVKGKAPEKYDVGRYAKKRSPFRYMLYPHDLLGEDRFKRVPLILSVDVMEDK